MMQIRLVCVGNLKEKFWIDACQEYVKRLQKFCKLQIVEISEQNKFDDVEKIKAKEGELILQSLQGDAILLALDGKEVTSEQFSVLIERKTLTTSQLTFVIGGSYGVSEAVKKAIPTKITLGKMTYPHNLARVILLEQIYRGYMIKAGSTYHK